MMLSQIEARLAKMKDALETAEKVSEEPPGSDAKTVGVKVDSSLYSMLQEVQQLRGIKSIKASLLLCAAVGARSPLGRR